MEGRGNLSGQRRGRRGSFGEKRRAVEKHFEIDVVRDRVSFGNKRVVLAEASLLRDNADGEHH